MRVPSPATTDRHDYGHDAAGDPEVRLALQYLRDRSLQGTHVAFAAPH